MKNQSWFPYAMAICVGILFYTLLNNLNIFGTFFGWLWKLVKPLLYGLILAYLMDPVARFYENKPFKKMKNRKAARQLGVVLGIITILIAFALLGAGIIPALIQSFTNIFNLMYDALQNIDENSGAISAILPEDFGSFLKGISIDGSVMEKISSFVNNNKETLANTSETIGNIGSGFANFVIAFILAIYYMMDKDRLKGMARRGFILILKDKGYDRFHTYVRRADKILLRYIKCNLLEGVIVGVINAIFMLIGGIPYVLLISIIVGITNLAPTFGPIVGAAIGAILLVLINPWYALAFLIFTVVLQTLDGYIIKPKLFGETLGVSPLLILIMIIVGGRLCGVLGIVLAIPFAAIAQFLADDLWKNRKSQKQSEVKTEVQPQEQSEEEAEEQSEE